jgi:glucokinase
VTTPGAARSAAPPTVAVAAGHVAALDLGASRIRAAVVAPDGRVQAKGETPTPSRQGPAAVIAASVGELERAIAAVAADGNTPVAISISAPGPLDPIRGRLVEPPNLGPSFRDVDFAGPIGAALGLPVAMERDTNVAALGELAFGAARGATEFLYITVSTGLGGAIVSGGRIFGGADGAAGEIGHIAIGIDEPPCACGGRGHLEAIVSGVAIAKAGRAALADGRSPFLAVRVGDVGSDALSAKDVAAGEDAGDEACGAIMARARAAFAAAIVGLVNLFDPERIVVGGGLAMGQGERLIGPARDAVATTAFRIPRERVVIAPAALGDDVGLVGGQPLVAGRIPALEGRSPLPGGAGRP